MWILLLAQICVAYFFLVSSCIPQPAYLRGFWFFEEALSAQLLPVGFQTFVISRFPELDDQRLLPLLELAISNIHTPSIKQHREHPDCFFISFRVMRQFFGGGYQRYLQHSDFIQVHGDYSKTGGTTYPYRVTEKLKELLISFAAHSLESSNSGVPCQNRQQLQSFNGRNNGVLCTVNHLGVYAVMT